jgi:uncharacterized membrane protein YdjX (TVP38/TMEM64 family)
MRRVRSIAYAVLAVAFIAAMYLWIESLGGPTAIRERFGTRGIAVSVIAHWILNLTPLGEVVPMALANGAIWGFWIGALVSWSGWMGASITQYLFVRRVGTEFNVSDRLERLPERIRALPVGHPLFQIAGRSLPWVGLHLVNVASAVRGVPFPRFLAFAALGQAGPALTMSALGAGLLSLL